MTVKWNPLIVYLYPPQCYVSSKEHHCDLSVGAEPQCE